MIDREVEVESHKVEVKIDINQIVFLVLHLHKHHGTAGIIRKDLFKQIIIASETIGGTEVNLIQEVKALREDHSGFKIIDFDQLRDVLFTTITVNRTSIDRSARDLIQPTEILKKKE